MTLIHAQIIFFPDATRHEEDAEGREGKEILTVPSYKRNFADFFGLKIKTWPGRTYSCKGRDGL
jgi:hypothetical protein